jgi:hypothetical protein
MEKGMREVAKGQARLNESVAAWKILMFSKETWIR